MLQIVVMPVEVGLNFVFMQQGQNGFDQLGRVPVFAAGINRMVADDYFPSRL